MFHCVRLAILEVIFENSDCALLIYCKKLWRGVQSLLLVIIAGSKRGSACNNKLGYNILGDTKYPACDNGPSIYPTDIVTMWKNDIQLKLIYLLRLWRHYPWFRYQKQFALWPKHQWVHLINRFVKTPVCMWFTVRIVGLIMLYDHR